jgi:hypothetical protein
LITQKQKFLETLEWVTVTGDVPPVAGFERANRATRKVVLSEQAASAEKNATPDRCRGGSPQLSVAERA